MNKHKLFYKIFSIIILVAVMITTFYLSAQDASDSSATSGFFTDLIHKIIKIDIPDEVTRTLAHFSEYCALGFLMHNAFYAFTVKRKYIISSICSWAYAWSDEIHQIFVEGRAFQLSDLAVDLCGILLGAFIMVLIIKIYNIYKNIEKMTNSN